jgi:CubicO group peptidase (beta-lactamase class C family)
VPRSKQARLTSVYAGRNNTLTVNDDRNNSPFSRDRDLPSGGGGGVSTAIDYMRFQAMLLNEGQLDGVRVLKPETVRQARSSMMDPGVTASGFGGVGNYFGAGMQILGKASQYGEGVGTYGWDGAAGTTMWIDPVNKVAVCGMVQIQGGATIHAPLREAVYKDFRARGWVKA